MATSTSMVMKPSSDHGRQAGRLSVSQPAVSAAQMAICRAARCTNLRRLGCSGVQPLRLPQPLRRIMAHQEVTRGNLALAREIEENRLEADDKQPIQCQRLAEARRT